MNILRELNKVSRDLVGGQADKKYDTKAKRIKFLKTPGSIVTFKKPFQSPRGPVRQVIVKSLETDYFNRQVYIEGRNDDSPGFDDINDLEKAIDWKWMERKH
jgi:hypothetical protein